jgi:protein TonB
MSAHFKHRVSGLAWMFGGVLLVIASIIFMNQQAAKPDNGEGVAGTTVQVQRKEKPPSAAPVQRREPPKRRPAKAPPTPLVGLEGGLAGLDFGLPQFDDTGLDDLAGSLLGESKDLVMTDDSVDVPPRPLLQTPMQYPSRAKASGVTGYVILSLLIGPTGQVERVKVIEAQPAGVFDEVAASGVQTWKFEPASYKGENVRVWATQKVRFDLS